MEKTGNMPIWVFLAFSSINKRKHALLLIWACVVFSIYCVPWPIYFESQIWVANIFLIDDWSWIAMMIPITLWYWASLKWMDKNSAWGVKPGP